MSGLDILVWLAVAFVFIRGELSLLRGRRANKR